MTTLKLKRRFFESMLKRTFVLSITPYGERIPVEIDEFYEQVGNTLKHQYEEDCTIWLISSDIENLKFIGLRTVRN